MTSINEMPMTVNKRYVCKIEMKINEISLINLNCWLFVSVEFKQKKGNRIFCYIKCHFKYIYWPVNRWEIYQNPCIVGIYIYIYPEDVN